MKVTSISVLACAALALAACSPAQNPASPTSSAPVTGATVPATPTATQVLPTNTPSGPVGSISGNIIPVGSAQPATSLKIFAREKNVGTIYTADFPIDATNYKISNLPPGVYNIFAWYYKGGLPGAYTSAKITFAGTSEDQFNCTNSLLDITISTTSLDFTGADIACWGGNFFSYLPQDLLP
jgi:hypothetical protein